MNAVECMTGLTVKKDKKDNWIVQKKGSKGINQRFGKLDGLIMFLNPETRDLKFEKIKSTIQAKIDQYETELKTSDVIVSKKIQKDKINYLRSMVELFESFAESPDMKSATDNFVEIVKQFVPEFKELVGLLAHHLYESSIIQEKFDNFMKEWKEKSNQERECHSNCMTTSEALEFWRDRSNFVKGNSKNETRVLVRLQDAVIRFLNYLFNSSNCERIFGKMQKSASPIRNRLHVDTIGTETLTMTIRKQHDIFELLKVPLNQRIGFIYKIYNI